MRDWKLIKRDIADMSSSDAYSKSFALKVLPSKSGMHPFWEGQFRLSQDAVFNAICIYPLDYPPYSPKFKILLPAICSILYPDFKHLYPSRKLVPRVDGELYSHYPNERLLCLDDCICTFYPADASWITGHDSIVTLFNFTVHFLVCWVRYVRSGYDPKAWPMQESPHEPEEILFGTPFDAPCPYECGKPFGECHHATKLMEQVLIKRLLRRDA